MTTGAIMTRPKRSVTHSRRRSSDLPDVFSSLVLVWTYLEKAGVAEQIRERLVLDRTRGVCGVELVAYLVAMWTSGHVGQRALQDVAEGHHAELCTLLGLRQWATQASISRALSCVNVETGMAFCDWLLGEALPPDAAELSDAAFHRDTYGEKWRVVDTDGRVSALRQRALPRSSGEFQKRHADTLAAAGHAGRKRGEVQFHQMIVQDAGGGRTLSVSIAPGNGEHRKELTHAITIGAQWADRLNLPRRRLILRFDGKSPGVPALAACLAAGVQFVTRGANYNLLSDPAVVRHMNESEWSDVPDSGSGPRRQVLDLGLQRLVPSEGTRTDSGAHFPSVDTRVLVTRFRCTEKRGAGIVIGEYQYEMFVTSLPDGAWPTPEVVSLYYNRAGSENRFWQHDRETGRPRTLSYSLGGQLLASTVGCFVEHVQFRLGVEISGLTDPTPPQPRQIPATAPAVIVASLDSEAERVKTTASPESSEPLLGAPHPAPPSRPVLTEMNSKALQRITLTLLPFLNWNQELTNHSGWLWNADAGHLQCPTGKATRLRRVRNFETTAELAFRVREGAACTSCSLRPACTSSTNPRFVKELTLRITATALQNAANAKDSGTPTVMIAQPPADESADTSLPAVPGPLEFQCPSIVPSLYRSAARRLTKGLRASVRATESPDNPDLAVSANAVRQHRRRDRRYRLACRLRPAGEQPRIQLVTQVYLSQRETDVAIRIVSACNQRNS